MGGYFGARLLAAGRDVTFLVRPKRAVALAKSGLVVKSKAGDLHLPSPPTVTSEQLNGSYDLIIVSCKAYDLDGAIASFAPAVHEKTVIIPLLNGLRHLDVLNARFGEKRPQALYDRACLCQSAIDQDQALAIFQRTLPGYGMTSASPGTENHYSQIAQID